METVREITYNKNMQIVIDTKQILKKLNGEPLKQNDKDFTIGDAIGNILSSDEGAGKMKTYVLAKRFTQEKKVDLDEVDFRLLKQLVERTHAFTAIIVGQVLFLLDEAAESKESESQTGKAGKEEGGRKKK